MYNCEYIFSHFSGVSVFSWKSLFVGGKGSKRILRKYILWYAVAVFIFFFTGFCFIHIHFVHAFFSLITLPFPSSKHFLYIFPHVYFSFLHLSLPFVCPPAPLPLTSAFLLFHRSPDCCWLLIKFSGWLKLFVYILFKFITMKYGARHSLLCYPLSKRSCLLFFQREMRST